MAELDEAIHEFLIEGQENLAALEKIFLEGEAVSPTRENLAGAFRILHSLKGSAGFLQFTKLEEVAHAAESFLVRLRGGDRLFDRRAGNLLLLVIDALREMLASIARGQGDLSAAIDCASLADELRREALAVVVPPVATSPKPGNLATDVLSILLSQAGESPGQTILPGLGEESRESGRMGGESSVRINLDLVDRLMALASEMVLARNRIVQQVSQMEHPALAAASRQLNQVTTELQEAVMKMRMYPISNLWNRLPRMVRDLAQQMGKRCQLETAGGSTELDKTLIEAIKDPLVHLVRNSVDHGIEAPGDRMKAGKKIEGRVRLAARHEAGQVIIELTDDGKGLDPVFLRAKAVEKKLLTEEQAARLNDTEALFLIFQPGFSTAAALSQVSGRGIGMDVVKTNIEKLGGAVDLTSTPGQGTTVRMRIPLTLAILNALVVSCGGEERYALPQSGIVELLRLQGEKLATMVEPMGDGRFLRFRGRLLPLLDLAEMLHPGKTPGEADCLSVVVLRTESSLFALAVRRILDAQEIVVKPLPAFLKNLQGYGGATLLGDGGIALILDANGLAAHAGLRGRLDESGPLVPQAHESQEAFRSLLLVEIIPGREHAFPLDRVERLEEIKPGAIEQTSAGPLVRYRGGVLPLVDLPGRVSGISGWLEGEAVARGSIPVVVHRCPAGLRGMMVRRIIDTVDEPWKLVGDASGPGMEGVALVRGRVVELLDPTFWATGGRANG